MHKYASLILSAAIMLVSGAAVVIAMDWPLKAKLFPLVIGIPVFCMAAAEVAWGLFGSGQRGEAMDFQLSDQTPRPVAIRRSLQAVAWMLGFFSVVALLGFPIAIPLFVFLYLRLQGREGWLFSVAFSAVLWVVFYGVFDRLLHLPFPAGLLQGWLGLA